MHNPALEHVWKEEGEKMELTDDLQCNRFVLKLPPEPKWNSYGYRRFTVITFVSVCCRNTEPLPSPTAKGVVSAPSSGMKGAEEGGGDAHWSARRSPSADGEARGWNARRQHAPLTFRANDIQIYGSSMRANGGLEMNEADLPAL